MFIQDAGTTVLKDSTGCNGRTITIVVTRLGTAKDPFQIRKAIGAFTFKVTFARGARWPLSGQDTNPQYTGGVIGTNGAGIHTRRSTRAGTIHAGQTNAGLTRGTIPTRCTDRKSAGRHTDPASVRGETAWTLA